jgi:Amt family ammonium transporter
MDLLAGGVVPQVEIYPGSEMTGADAVWYMVATALVLFMVPGLALFYGGMVRSKNMLGMLMLNFYCLGIVPLVWVVVAFSLLSGSSGGNSWIGGTDFIGMDGLLDDGPALIDAMFALTFAVITPALIAGAVADRIKFWAWIPFVPLWVVLVYVPIGHWVWAGWLFDRGALDFAGGTVVHINAGAAALACVLILGARKGWPREGMAPHSLPLTLLGAGILWFGWFGFNAGSAFAADNIALIAFYNTFVAAAAGMIGWLAIETIRDGRPTSLGAASGIVAGLVAITPAAGFVGGMSPIFFGLAAGVLCYLAIQLKYKLQYDDSLDVIGVHFVGGMVGTLLVGFFADAAVNPAVAESAGEGLFAGGSASLLGEQALAAVVATVYSFVVTFLIFKVIDVLIGVRVSEEAEAEGLDQSQHAENAYNLTEAL